jgi:hypothetical protein
MTTKKVAATGRAAAKHDYRRDAVYQTPLSRSREKLVLRQARRTPCSTRPAMCRSGRNGALQKGAGQDV